MTATTTTRHSRILDSHVVLTDADARILLTLRQNTGYQDQRWHCPSGHVEATEDVRAAAAREAGEELGIAIDPADLALAHVIDRRRVGEQPRTGFFFQASTWRGEPIIAEPDKCGGLDWFAPDRLPETIIDYHATALEHIAAGRIFSTFGVWP